MDIVTQSLLAYWQQHHSQGGGKRLPTAALVFWAPLDTWSTTAASGHTLTYKGTSSTAIAPTETTYKGVKCCEFAANSYWRAVTSVKEERGAYAGTLSFWMAPKQALTTSYAMGGPVACKNNDTGLYGYGIYKSSSPARFRVGARASSAYNTYDDTPNSTKWHHYLITLECAAGWTSTARHITAWVDGEQKKDNTTNVANYGLTRTFIGNPNETNNALYIAGVRLYNRILTADEIAALAEEYEPTT